MEITNSFAIMDEYDFSDRESYLTERVFNVVGYIPLICVPSGAVRALYGLVQIVIGVATGTFHLAGDLIRSAPKGYGYRAMRNYAHVSHGFGNVIRGAIEALTVLGLPSLVYDITGLRYSYEGEKKYKKVEIMHMNQLSQKIEHGL